MEAVERHVAVSARMRPMLNQARLDLLRGDLELVKTRDGCCPCWTFSLPWARAVMPMLSATPSHQPGRGQLRRSGRGPTGLSDFQPRCTRPAPTGAAQPQPGRKSARQPVSTGGNGRPHAYIEVDAPDSRLTPLRSPAPLMRKSCAPKPKSCAWANPPAFLVAQAQRDLLVSRIAEVRAIVNYLKALIDLYYQDGSLLERRGIAAPGREPVILSQTGRGGSGHAYRPLV
jgi:outer membrane protein